MGVCFFYRSTNLLVYRLTNLPVYRLCDGRLLRGRSLQRWVFRRFVVAARRLAYGY